MSVRTVTAIAMSANARQATGRRHTSADATAKSTTTVAAGAHSERRKYAAQMPTTAASSTSARFPAATWTTLDRRGPGGIHP
jgi:hypothetical protein